MVPYDSYNSRAPPAANREKMRLQEICSKLKANVLPGSGAAHGPTYYHVAIATPAGSRIILQAMAKLPVANNERKHGMAATLNSRTVRL